MLLPDLGLHEGEELLACLLILDRHRLLRLVPGTFGIKKAEQVEEKAVGEFGADFEIYALDEQAACLIVEHLALVDEAFNLGIDQRGIGVTIDADDMLLSADQTGGGVVPVMNLCDLAMRALEGTQEPRLVLTLTKVCARDVRERGRLVGHGAFEVGVLEARSRE